MDQDPRPGLELGGVGAKQLSAVLVRPVVEDLADVVDLGTDRLRREDVARHEVHAVLERVGHGRVGIGLVHLHVLHEEVEVGEALGQGDRDAAPEAPNIDHLGITEPCPVVSVE